MATFTPRAPRGIRRHYSQVETILAEALDTNTAHDITDRPHTGIHAKKLRMAGLRTDTHTKDGSGKYSAQRRTKGYSDRNGHPWMSWEDDFLLRNADKQSLTAKALVLGRTYRAVESRRRDILRNLDSQNRS